MVESVASHLSGELTPPFAFFGHSMGSILAYELACLLRRNGLPQPVHIFASGRRGPQVPRRYEPFHELPDDQFIQRLRQLNGTPEELFQHAELLAFILPTLKADFAVCENYLYRGDERLDCPVTGLGGLDDPDISREDVSAWGAITRGRFRAEMFVGDHFFLNTSRSAVLAAVAADLRKTLLSRAG